MNHEQMLKPLLVVAGGLAAVALAGVPVGNVVFPLLALACPLMMIFMMRGMGHGHGGGSPEEHTRTGHDHR